MQSLRLRDGVREARGMFAASFQLIKRFSPAALEVIAALVLLPALLRAYMYIDSNRVLLSAWDEWFSAVFSGGTPRERLFVLALRTLQEAPANGNGSGVLALVNALFLLPLFYSTTALLLNGYVASGTDRLSVAASKMALLRSGKLVIAALICMLAKSFLSFLPSIVTGLFSAIAGLLSFLPFIGAISVEISVVFSIAVSLVTDFVINALLCYVWICVTCEGSPGLHAVAQSFYYLRANARATIATLLAFTLCKWLVYVGVGLLWLVLGRGVGMSLDALVYCFYAVEAVFLGWFAALTSALYQGKGPGAPRDGASPNTPPNLDQMKRANINE